jgi:hypothetical protein
VHLTPCFGELKHKRYTWRHDSVLKNIELSIASLVADFNQKKPTTLVKATRKAIEASFFRKGERKQRGNQPPLTPSVLACANDWKLRVDFDAKKVEFPPKILATSLRPDIVLWSEMSRVVLLIELTCPAEEGMAAAQLRKETKYSELLDSINATNVWKASLSTLEIGARGLVGLSSHKTFVRLGFTSSQARALCKRLSSVAVRCSYAIYQAHNNLAWSHGSDLIIAEGSPVVEVKEAPEGSAQTPKEQEPRCNNAKTLREHGIQSLFHFTDASNLESIRQHGLLTWKKLEDMKIAAKMNSSELSHKLDSSKGLADFVRLSFCKKHPMMYIALKEKRISVPVVLEIKLEVVSRPGVLFCGVNAASKAAKASESPRVIRFDVVAAYSQHEVEHSLRPFFQGEVLIPEWIPPHLIKIPKVDIFTKSLELRGRLPDSNLALSASRREREGLIKASEPKPRVSPIEVLSAGNGKSSHETFAAPKSLGKSRTVPWTSNLLTEFQRERKERLFSLVPPHHVPVGTQFGYDLDENFREKNGKKQKKSNAA